jgi:hypothetical protein
VDDLNVKSVSGQRPQTLKIARMVSRARDSLPSETDMEMVEILCRLAETAAK